MPAVLALSQGLILPSGFFEPISPGFAVSRQPMSLLRSSCKKRLAAIARNPALIQIVQSGAADSGRGILNFRREAKMTLIEIGKQLAPHDCAPKIKVRSRPGTLEEFSLESVLVTIKIYGQRWNWGNAIAYWRSLSHFDVTPCRSRRFATSKVS